MLEVFCALSLPFAGTVSGAACVFFMRGDMDRTVQHGLLGFAAGAMLYVVVEDLIPEMSAGEHSNIGTICFAAGFTVMMVLDVALG